MLFPTALLLPYGQAAIAQRAQAPGSLRTRLRQHFPALADEVFARALAELQPDLLCRGPQVAFPVPELTQLVQHLAASPELPLLDPPIYGWAALELAQRVLHAQELTERVLLETSSRGPWLRELLAYLSHPGPLAGRVVQAWRWDLASAPALPPGLPVRSARSTPGCR